MNDSVSDLFVNNNTDRVGVDVENSSGSSVVEFMGHTFMGRTISSDIDIVSNFVINKESGEMRSSVSSERSGE